MTTLKGAKIVRYFKILLKFKNKQILWPETFTPLHRYNDFTGVCTWAHKWEVDV
jgi:hypothetical protein